jgi:two-component system chemotaxis response regulator CheY
MPVMDGFEFVKAVRLLATFQSVPVLMLTADSQQEKKEDGKGAGVFAWKVKPFSPLQLLKVVDMLCS